MKKRNFVFTTMIVLFAAVFSFMFTKDAYAASKKAVKSLNISDKKVIMQAGTDVIIRAEVKAKTGADLEVKAVSGKDAVAEVKSNVFRNGYSYVAVHSNAPGKAVIKVTTKGKNAKNKCITKKINVTVTENTGDETIINDWLRTNMIGIANFREDGTGVTTHLFTDGSDVIDLDYTFNGSVLKATNDNWSTHQEYDCKAADGTLTLTDSTGNVVQYAYMDQIDRRQPLNGNCYSVIDKELTWDDAEQFCEDIGGHLAVISSAEENAFVGKLLDASSSDNYWLGGYREVAGTEGWQWVTGEEWSYDNWDETKPRVEAGKMFLMMESSEGFKWDSIGDDIKDGALHQFVCEWEADPALLTSSSLIGTWRCEEEFIYFIFGDNGKGEYACYDGYSAKRIPIVYKDNGAYVTMSFDYWRNWRNYNYIIKDNILTINGDDGNPVVFKRVSYSL